MSDSLPQVGRYPRGLDDVGLHLVESIDDVLALFAWLGERRPVHALAVDSETTGLVIGQDRVRLVQVGDGQHGWAMAWDGWAGLFADLVRRWDGNWLAQNMKFDEGMLAHAPHTASRLPRGRVWDVRILHHVLFPQYSSALKSMGARLIDSRAGSLQGELRSTGWTWATVPTDYQPYWSYAALDTVLTYRLFELLSPVALAEAREAVATEHEVTWILADMERYGAHVDRAYTAGALVGFHDRIKTLAAFCRDTYGVSPGQNARVAQVLVEAGYQLDKPTATGALALDKEVLADCLDHPLAQAVLDHRQLTKLASTYLTHFDAEPDADDLIHPSINVLGARTGRMSMERPNLQNLPRRSEDRPDASMVRSCISAREGHTLVMCDFDQIEMRLLAHLANEQPMLDAFRGDLDFFVAMARLIYGDESIVKSDPRRQITKTVGYATIYGAGLEKFRRTAGISLERATQVRGRWDELFPGVRAFQRQVQDLALERRLATGTPFVRCPVSRRFHVAEAGKEYALVNYLIQGLAAHLFKRKLIELEHAGLGPWMVAPVHDEVVLDVPTEQVPAVAEILLKVMNDDAQLRVPLTASVSVGANWGAKEDYRVPDRS